LTLAFALSAALSSAQTTREAVRDQITLTGTVEAVDYTARTVRVRGSQGNVTTLDVPRSATRFEQVKVGDTITIEYFDKVIIRPKPPGEAVVDRYIEPTTTPTPGALPGATVARSRVATVTIVSWDPATKIVNFTGPTGAAYSRRLLDTADPSILAGLKAGDRVDVTWTEALRVSVQSPAAAAPPQDDLRHRLTLAVQWGPDNTFAGHMITAATGTTRLGVPINLHETTYDDVYGRMGLFKVGASYRTSPRTEGVFNIVISRSGSQPVNVGTAGTGATAVPLTVNFDPYNYWGFEGGQRWFFARVRFTPYVGYLVGVNHNGEIKGTFVNVPPNLTPDLAAADNVFFNGRWRVSFGPTGGVLVGIGPLEAFAELQIRYMGGLSDVNWLVDEGLKDINQGSSRWSLPILFGARFRFP